MNFVVKNEHWDEAMEKILFGDDPIIYLKLEDFDFFDMLVAHAGAFSSKGQARRSVYGPLGKQPPGFNDLTVGKFKFRLTTWIPIGMANEISILYSVDGL